MTRLGLILIAGIVVLSFNVNAYANFLTCPQGEKFNPDRQLGFPNFDQDAPLCVPLTIEDYFSNFSFQIENLLRDDAFVGMIIVILLAIVIGAIVIVRRT